MFLKPPPWEERRKLPFQWSDEDEVRTAAWLQTNRILATPLTARQASATVARERPFTRFATIWMASCGTATGACIIGLRPTWE